MIAKEEIQKIAKEQFNWLREIRRHLHKYPELSFKETKTAEFISQKLDELSIPHHTGIAGTGIVGIINGGKGSGKILALRGDMDALPIQEKNEVEYRSQHENVMHACGHDVHTSCLLGAAAILKKLEKEFAGTIKVIFQPGEEVLPGGASLMIKEGVLRNPDVELIFGQHVFPEMDAGQVGFRPGRYMASSDEIRIKVIGKGGHGAMPHQIIDPILISAHIITALQQIVSRNANPGIPTVLSFGKIIGEGATNIIPDEVRLEGTFRTMNEEWREKAHQLLEQSAVKIAESMGAKCEVEITKGYPVLENDHALTSLAINAAKDYLGIENVHDLDIRMTAEDFAWFSHQIPACFYRLGVRNQKKNIVHPVHNSRFDIEESALETGMGLMAWLAVIALNKKEEA